MPEAFDKDYWEAHWQPTDGPEAGREIGPNPYLARELAGLEPGTALDAGCGEGAEALWLASEGWLVTAVDISAAALARAVARAAQAEAARDGVQWVEADLTAWEPGQQFELVTTHYAHPAMDQLAFYDRISGWVAPGGTLLIVGHGHPLGPPALGHSHGGPSHGHQGHGHQSHGPQGHEVSEQGRNPPEEASVTASGITARLDAAKWDIVTADELVRTLGDRADRTVHLDDVVVRATRRR